MNFLYALLLIISINIVDGKECSLSTPLKSFYPKYAKHFSIQYYSNFKILSVHNERYLLKENHNIKCETSAIEILTPAKKIAMTSTTYLGALELMEKESSLIAFQGKANIVSSKFNLKEIREISYKLNIEDLLSIKPDFIMGYEENLNSTKQLSLLKKLKVPFVLNKDFEETTPLGRAEWLVFISSFFNEEEKAIKIFNEISSRYLEIKNANLQNKKITNVIVGDIQSGFWMMCGDKSDLGQLIKDAGGELAFKNSSPLTQKISLEKIGSIKKNYDIWLTHNTWKNSADLNQARKNDNRYSLIRHHEVYNNTRLVNSNGANDYWEMGLQRPDLMLLDLSAIFHPENFKNHQLVWYQKL